jgi:hypothetical protein
LNGGGGSVDTGSFATTGSNIFIGNQTVTGSVDVTGSFINNGLTYPLVDNGEGAFLQTDGAGNLSLQYVQSILEPIRNGELTTLLKGTPVYVSGALGANPIVYRADANDPSKMPVTYIVSDDLLSDNVGTGLILGKIDGVNTTGFLEGTEIFVGIGGGYTDVRPTGSAIVQSLGIVTKEGTGGQGIILNPGPANLPNIQEGYLWVGDSDSYPTPVLTSSLDVATSVSSSYSDFALSSSQSQNSISSSHSVNSDNSISSSFATNAISSSYSDFAVTASFALNGGGGSVDTGSFATTGSNNFFGTQNITGSLDVSGSLFLKSQGKTGITANFSYITASDGVNNLYFQDNITANSVSQSLIVSSSNNIIFRRPAFNNNAFDSVIIGSDGSNIFGVPPRLSATNRGQTIAGAFRHNYNNTSATSLTFTFSTGSLTGSLNVGQNNVMSSFTYNAPQVNRLPTISQNNINGNVTYTSNVLGYFDNVAPFITSNNINGANIDLNARSGSMTLSRNNINGNLIELNNNFSGSNTQHYLEVSNNSIGGSSNTISVQGSNPSNQRRWVQNNIIGGIQNTIIGRNESTENGNLFNSLIVGSRLTVTASHSTDLNSSTFLGCFNETGSYLSDSSETIFALGTGTDAASRRTSLHVSSSGLLDVRSGMVQSGSLTFFNNSTTGSFNLSGSLNIIGSSVFDGNQTITGSIQGNVLPLTVSSNTASLNLDNGNFFELALTGSSDIRIEPSNIKPGQTINLKLNTTGSATVSFPSSVKQVSGSSYVPSTGTTTDIVTLISFDSTNLFLANVKNLI